MSLQVSFTLYVEKVHFTSWSRIKREGGESAAPSAEHKQILCAWRDALVRVPVEFSGHKTAFNKKCNSS